MRGHQRIHARAQVGGWSGGGGSFNRVVLGGLSGGICGLSFKAAQMDRHERLDLNERPADKPLPLPPKHLPLPPECKETAKLLAKFAGPEAPPPCPHPPPCFHSFGAQGDGGQGPGTGVHARGQGAGARLLRVCVQWAAGGAGTGAGCWGLLRASGLISSVHPVSGREPCLRASGHRVHTAEPTRAHTKPRHTYTTTPPIQAVTSLTPPPPPLPPPLSPAH